MTAAPSCAFFWAKGTRDIEHDYERWNAFSRLTVDTNSNDPTGGSLGLVIDSTAGTILLRWSGDPQETDFLRDQVQNLAHFIRHDADIYVVGMGGGADVLSALEFDQRSVTGVEINGDIIDITNDRYGDFTGQLDEHPAVTIVNDDARSYLARTDVDYDRPALPRSRSRGSTARCHHRGTRGRSLRRRAGWRCCS